MGRIHIRKISLNAFRAFKDKNSTKILPKNGLIGIRGGSPNGVSSGAGKSSIGLAITYAFGYCPFSASSQQNWHTKNPMQVELELDTHLGPALLKRGKEFSLTVNGITTQGAAKLVEGEIQKLIGIPLELFEILTYRQQQERSKFLKMTDSRKREFLSTLLGIGELEEKISESVKKSNELQKELDGCSRVVETLEKVLEDPGSEPMLADLSNLELTVENLLKEFQLELEKYNNRPSYVSPDDKINEINVKIGECNTRIKLLEEKEKSGKEKLKSRFLEIQQKISDINNKLSTINVYSKGIQNLELQNLKLSENKCNVCLRPWEGSQEQILKNEDTINSLRTGINQFQEEERVKQELIQELNSTQELIQNFKVPNLDVIKEIKSELLKQLAVETEKSVHAKNNFNNQIKSLEYKKKSAEQDYQIAKGNLNAERSKNDVILNNWKQANRKYKENLQLLESARKDYENKLKRSNEEYDFADSIRKYLTSLFDQILYEISQEANEYLKCLSNTPTTTILFTTETVTEKNGVKQEIKPIILKSGMNIDLKSGISGGQLESVELAIDLAICKVIGERTGVRPGFIIFDESFGAHCPVVKQSCMEILKKASEECLIFVIDHATEMRDYFDDFIDVFSNNEVSTLIQ